MHSLLMAFNNIDPPKKQQKAITPKLLRAMYQTSGASLPCTNDTAQATAADLAVMAFFFALRSCKFTTVRKPGQT
jgi:hypothetical protein